MLPDSLISLSLVGLDEIVLNLLVGPAEQPSQVLFETKGFRGVALDEFIGIEGFLLVYVAIRIIEGILGLAKVN